VDSASPLDAPAVATSLLAFIVVYFIVFGMGVLYILRLMKATASWRGRTAPGCPPAPQASRPRRLPLLKDKGDRHGQFTFDIAMLWAFIIAFAVFMYIVMDGFDLGLGMLFPFFPEKHDRDVMMNTVAPVWDGNETWLVLGGGGLMAAFPLAYAILMPALYTPIIAMLIGLIFRGVRVRIPLAHQSERNRWDIAFAGGSLVAAMAQGIALGAILQGSMSKGVIMPAAGGTG
jgi:hypothetical protein